MQTQTTQTGQVQRYQVVGTERGWVAVAKRVAGRWVRIDKWTQIIYPPGPLPASADAQFAGMASDVHGAYSVLPPAGKEC